MGDPSKPRAFVHVVNGTAGVAHVHELYDLLQKSLPQSPVYLLTLIDGQEKQGSAKLSKTTHPNVLFYKVPFDIWTTADFQGLNTLAGAYTSGIGQAIKVWSGELAANENPNNLADLYTDPNKYYANSPKYKLYHVIEGESD